MFTTLGGARAGPRLSEEEGGWPRADARGREAEEDSPENYKKMAQAGSVSRTIFKQTQARDRTGDTLRIVGYEVCQATLHLQTN